MEISSFPKIFALGTRNVKNIFDGPVEITEKVDGSQFAFGKVNGELFCRSKGRVIYEQLEKNDLFYPAVETASSLFVAGRLPEGHVFYGETLCKPKHNNLKYDRVPKNNIALFAVYKVSEDEWLDYGNYRSWAGELDIDYVPLFGVYNKITVDNIHDILNTESFLGGANIEGVVVKNYNKQVILTESVILPIMCGKYVSEKYKEVAKGWKKENTGKGKWEDYKQRYRTHARWEKAIQHLRENNEIEDDPRDIGKLIKEVHRDITEEEKEEIKEYLWKEFGGALLRTSTAGLPEWYKQKLLDECI